MTRPLSDSQPQTLAECFPALDAFLSEEDKDWLTYPHWRRSFVLAIAHSSLGRHIRNEWGLWDDKSPLHLHLKEQGIPHPDDMSHAILEGYLRFKCPTIWDRLTDPLGGENP